MPRSAEAQSCCGANSATDFGVVAPQALATVASMLSYRQGFGNFDASGRFKGNRGLVDRDVILRLGGGLRLPYRPLQINANVPVQLQHRDLGDVSQSALGLGDAVAALRWTALQPTLDGIDFDQPESLIPLWDLFVGGKLPTGAQPGADRDPSGADVFGNGAYELSLGTMVTKSLTTRHLVALRFQYDYRFATDRDVGGGDTVRFQPGNQVAMQARWIYTDSIFLTAGLFANLRIAGNVSQDGRALADTSERLLNMGGQVTYAFDYPNWDVTFGVNTDAFWNQGGVNVPFAGVTALLSLRRTFMDEEDHSGHHHGAGHEHHDHGGK